MCTLTIIPADERGSRVRVACNRDESRLRAVALPPSIHTFAACRAAMPIDPQGGGAWIAVSDRGLALSLLNLNPWVYDPARPRPPKGPVSRGLIIHRLLDQAGDFDGAVAAARRLNATDHSPFRLVLGDRRQTAIVRGDGHKITIQAAKPLVEPFFATSSGLGDSLVEAPRRSLFDEFFAGRSPADRVARQDEFHRHHWADRRDISVCMTRHDARTVSFTTIDLSPELAVMRYLGDSPDTAASPTAALVETRLPLVGAAGASI